MAYLFLWLDFWTVLGRFSDARSKQMSRFILDVFWFLVNFELHDLELTR